MPVAKSYQKYDIVCEPFLDNGRSYVNINKGGVLKTVRWYSEKEYAAMYKETKISGATITPTVDAPIVKEALGFKNGYIDIIKGDINKWEDYLNLSPARFCRLWGWYIISTEEVPHDFPHDLSLLRLSWNAVGNPDGTLLPEKDVAQAVEALAYPPTSSQFCGTVGERLDLQLTVRKTVPLETAWGRATLHIMEDANENEFIWKTNSKTLEIGKEYNLRGTVKAHNMWHNSKQTILTRCTIK